MMISSGSLGGLALSDGTEPRPPRFSLLEPDLDWRDCKNFLNILNARVTGWRKGDSARYAAAGAVL